MHRSAAIILAASLLCGAHPPVDFIPVGPKLEAPAREYRRIWEQEGERMIEALETLVGLPFPEDFIEVFITENRPMTSYDGRTIRLRASYTPTYKKATLVHEMGHRLAFLLPRLGGLDDHQILYLFLYDAWSDLYGPAFADRMVSIERRNRRFYDYDAAWDWALTMTREERQALLAELRARARSHGADIAAATPASGSASGSMADLD